MEELMGLPDGIVASVANMSGKGSRSREGSANTILADQCSLLGMSVAGPVADWLASTILRPHAFRWEGQGEAFDVAGAWFVLCCSLTSCYVRSNSSEELFMSGRIIVWRLVRGAALSN